jgi:G:T-mismatch repair DNA endonuclease (very short patch repair protein)
MKKNISKFGKKMKQMNGTSKLEVKFANLLNELNIKFLPHFNFKDREFDFLLVEHNILVETHGCFFHCCKEDGFKPEYAIQRKNIKNDQYKSKIVKFDKNYNLLIIWEIIFYLNIKYQKKQILENCFMIIKLRIKTL